MDDKSTPQGINLGHGAAVNGAVSIDSHNVIHEAQKTVEEIEQHRRSRFFDAAQQRMQGGMLDAQAATYLEGLRLQLALSNEVANAIIEQVRQSGQAQAAEGMDFLSEQVLQQVVGAIYANQVEQLRTLAAQLQAVAQRSSNEMVIYFNHLLQATFATKECVAQAKNSRTDNYWLTFWGCVAALKVRDYNLSRQLLVKLQSWNRYPGDLALLMALENQSNYRNDLQKTFYHDSAVMALQSLQTTPCSELLEFAGEAVKALVNSSEYDSSLAFYVEQVFAEFAISEEKKVQLEMEQLYAKAVGGNAQSQYAMAVLYYKGEGVKSDMAKAFYWFSAAANQGLKEACANLGQCYEYGLGTPANLQFAARYYRQGGREDLATAVEQRMMQQQAAQMQQTTQPVQSFVPGVGNFLKPGNAGVQMMPGMPQMSGVAPQPVSAQPAMNMAQAPNIPNMPGMPSMNSMMNAAMADAVSGAMTPDVPPVPSANQAEEEQGTTPIGIRFYEREFKFTMGEDDEEYYSTMDMEDFIEIYVNNDELDSEVVEEIRKRSADRKVLPEDVRQMEVEGLTACEYYENKSVCSYEIPTSHFDPKKLSFLPCHLKYACPSENHFELDEVAFSSCTVLYDGQRVDSYDIDSVGKNVETLWVIDEEDDDDDE